MLARRGTKPEQKEVGKNNVIVDHPIYLDPFSSQLVFQHAEIDGPAATILVSFDPSRTNMKTIAEAAKASLDSDHAHMMGGGSKADIEYLITK